MGAIDGAMKGGKDGMALGPEGAAAGAALGLATGLVQDVKAAKLKKQAEAAFPDFVDPNQSAFLAELGQKRKSIDTGADFATGMGTVDQTQAATNEALTRNTGGDATSTIQSLLQSQRNASNAKNNVLAQGQQQQMNYNQQYGDLLDKISGRKMQLQLQKSQQAMAEWAQMKQSSNQNAMAGAAGAVGSGGGGGMMDKLKGLGGGGGAPAVADGTAEQMPSLQTPSLPTGDVAGAGLAGSASSLLTAL